MAETVLRLGAYLAVPLRGSSLLLIVIFSVLLAFAAGGGVLGIPLAVIVVSWFFKYAFALLDHTAEGEREPPVLSYEMIHPLSEQRPLATMALLYGIYLGTDLLRASIGYEGVATIRIAVLVCLPAIIAVQGMSGSFFSALDPRKWVMLVLQLREVYVMILLAVGTFFLAGRAMLTFASETALPFGIAVDLKQYLSVIAVMYGWLALHTLIGGVLFEYRDRIGFEPSRSPERLAEKASRESDRDLDRVIDRIFAEWRGGAHGNAWRTVQAHLQSTPDRAAELRALFERISRWPDPRLGHLLARELVPELLAARQTGDALDIVRSRLRVDPTFRLASGGEVIRVAELARDAGDRRTARELLLDFGTRFPNDSEQATANRMLGELAR